MMFRLKLFLFSLITSFWCLMQQNDGYINFSAFDIRRNEANPDGGDGGAGGTPEGDGGVSGSNPPSNDPSEDLDSLPEWAKKKLQDQDKHIKDLRGENANRRVANKDLNERLSRIEGGMKKAFGLEDEEDEINIEDQVNHLQESLSESEYNNFIIQEAYDNEIPKEKISFFKFKLNEAFSHLGENDELPKEVYSQIIQEVKGLGKGVADTSGGSKNQMPSGDNGNKDYSKLTAEQFVKIGDNEQQSIYRTDRATYDKLYSQAKRERLFKFKG